MDQGLCGERDRCGKKASSRRRDGDYARAEQYNSSWKRGGDKRKARNNVWRNVECYRRQFSDLVSSDEEQDREDEEYDADDTQLGKLSDDDEPGWVMGTSSKPVQQHLESFRQKQMKHEKLTQPGWGDPANYICERDMKYGTTELRVPVVVKPQIDTTAATPSPLTFGEHKQTLEIVRGQWPMTAVTSQPVSSPMRLRSEKPQWHIFIPIVSPDAATDSM